MSFYRHTSSSSLAQAERLGVISYSPLGGGLLSGKYRDGGAQGRLKANAMYARRYELEMYRQIATRFAEYAAVAGVSPVTLAVAWAKRHPGVTAPIIGARNLEQLEPSLAAADYIMSGEEWTQIAGLTPPVPVATDRDEER